MSVVFKYPLPIMTTFTVELPEGARILSFQMQYDETPTIWALVDPRAPMRERRFCIGTVQVLGGELVWHLFGEKEQG